MPSDSTIPIDGWFCKAGDSVPVIPNQIPQLLGLKFDIILKTVKKLKPVKGRLEYLGSFKNNSKVILDFAHTPDALEKSLKTIKNHFNSKLSVLFGCGGERDKNKRAIMGNIARKYCDKIFVTSDNPRNESLETITSDIVNGFNLNKHKIIEDRKLAIKCAIDEMGENSILFVLGKGRESYQIINDDKIFFSDVDTIKNYIYAN